ncbi:MAG: hypothetical protein B7X65_23465 [Polaromonas sp. 39-63-25]|nr:MAG: hypothetical protein B7X65_23465 [Polaromonas sp. 39-63-25]
MSPGTNFCGTFNVQDMALIRMVDSRHCNVNQLTNSVLILELFGTMFQHAQIESIGSLVGA